jgi:hypothetical protein
VESFYHVSQLSITMTKYLKESTKKEERLFGLTIKVLVHSHVALLFWACVGILHHGRSTW